MRRTTFQRLVSVVLPRHPWVLFRSNVSDAVISLNERQMLETQPVTVETVSAVAVQLLGTPLTPANAAATAGLLNALAADMHALRKLPLGDDEPATTYSAVEGQA